MVEESTQDAVPREEAAGLLCMSATVVVGPCGNGVDGGVCDAEDLAVRIDVICMERS